MQDKHRAGGLYILYAQVNNCGDENNSDIEGEKRGSVRRGNILIQLIGLLQMFFFFKFIKDCREVHATKSCIIHEFLVCLLGA